MHKFTRTHGQCTCFNANEIPIQVKGFLEVVHEEEDTVVHGGAMKAPKVLAEIVESVVGAVYEDLQFDLKAMWLVCIFSSFPAICYSR